MRNRRVDLVATVHGRPPTSRLPHITMSPTGSCLVPSLLVLE